MRELDETDFGDIEDGVVTHAMRMRVMGEEAFYAGEPWEAHKKLSKDDKRWVSEWRQGWTMARNYKLARFEDYIKHRVLFEREYRPPGCSASHLRQIQEHRAGVIAKHEQRFPDFPAAFTKHQEWKKGDTAR